MLVMKNDSKNYAPMNNRKPTIDAKGKGTIEFEPINEALTIDYEKMIDDFNSKAERIREQYYSTDASLERIQSRTLSEITIAKIRQLKKIIEEYLNHKKDKL